ncbi:class I SAM-dependent methyltransferase [Luteimonas sp. MJ293]|uniref:class I SAM-dependent methyltransferase n=1 Tax=Luteimonas sp. MJ146 TaxID=3129240 RepID=UPI0031BB9153
MRRLWAKWRPLLKFGGSRDYWQQRYRRGGDSGIGSGGESARYKAELLNAFVSKFGIRSVVEFGCGDGRQLTLAQYPAYLGLDISHDAIALCTERFAGDPSKCFGLVEEHPGARADLAISLDVLFHLVEDEVYNHYLARLFDAGSGFVAIFTSDEPDAARALPHVRHRPVSQDIARNFPGFIAFDPGLQLSSAPPEPHDVPMKFLFYRRSTVPPQAAP